MQPQTLDHTSVTVADYLKADFPEQAAFLNRMAPVQPSLTVAPEGQTCVICLANPAEITTNPCGHTVMCASCDLEDFHSKVTTIISARRYSPTTVMNNSFFAQITRTCSVCRCPFQTNERSRAK